MHTFMDKLLCVGAAAFLLGLFVTGVRAQGSSCHIDIVAAPEDFNTPLLIRPRSRQVIYPELRDGNPLLTITSGETVVAACTGRSNALSLTNEKTVDVTCYDGQLVLPYELESQVVQLDDLECLNRPQATISRAPNSTCGEEGSRFTIGWNVREKLFVPVINMCFDKERETTEFTFHRVQGRSTGIPNKDPQRPPFRPNNMFSIDLKTVYKKKSQVPLFTDLLDTSEHLTGYGQHYLAKGHMAPDADFFYAAEQLATYFYGNVVPQWQGFNNGNWKRLEEAIRDVAEKQAATLDIWTGAYGTLQMPDINNNPVSMFLGLAERKRLVPVPALMWKVVYNPVIRSAVAIVSVNAMTGAASSNDVNLEEPPCPDVCNQLSWIDWDVRDVSRGLTYCCHVKDLKLIIPALPELGRVSLLNI